jgi:hypothetical protein
MRKLLIFGNGLGRAIDNDHFQLEAALQAAWNNSEILTDVQKELILRCLPAEVLDDHDINASAPKSEAELDKLQRVLAACDEISKHETDDGASWLTDDGKAFPIAIRSYLHAAASHFHLGPHTLPKEFVEPLTTWILESRSHVATLNYDELLYRSFVKSKVFNGYSCLLDGFVKHFDSSFLDRRNRDSQSYYLHLHGSPLYFNTPEGALKKASMGEVQKLQGFSSTHVVLTHVQHKASVIAASPILREYWLRLEEAMSEAESIVLVGYSGDDDHLNLLISNFFRNKRVEIVERAHADYSTQEGETERMLYWCKKLAVNSVVAHWPDSILQFTNWSS